MRFRNLTLLGNQGIRAQVDTDSADMTFEMVDFEALDLDAGSHTVTRSKIGDGVSVGADVADGAELTITRTEIRDVSDAGLIVGGTLFGQNLLIAGGLDGVRVADTGSLDLSYVTIADNTGVGVDNSLGGSVTSIDRSIVYGNAADDLVNIACSVVSWSDTGTPDCSSVNDNISADPLLTVDYRLYPASPCLEHGPDPSLYDGDPPTDTAGGPRLRDGDGDQSANNDCGAYEKPYDAAAVGDIQNVRWDMNFRMLWDADPAAVEYHIYRDLLSNLSYAFFGTCRDDLDGDRTDTQLDDLEEPAPGEGFSYLVTGEDAAGFEGTLGFATGAERTNYGPCP